MEKQYSSYSEVYDKGDLFDLFKDVNDLESAEKIIKEQAGGVENPKSAGEQSKIIFARANEAVAASNLSEDEKKERIGILNQVEQRLEEIITSVNTKDNRVIMATFGFILPAAAWIGSNISRPSEIANIYYAAGLFLNAATIFAIAAAPEDEEQLQKNKESEV